MNMCKRLYRVFTTLPLICAAALTIQSCSCNNGRSACHDYDMLANDMEFVRDMYEKVQYEDYGFLEKHCSKNLLKKLSEAYDYDGKGYAVWQFRSGAQDGPSKEHSIIHIEDEGDGWYTYTAIDMGITFRRKIKISHKGRRTMIEDVIDDIISDEAYQDEIGTYSAFAEHFSDTTYFALADVSGHQVLLVSHEVFGNNVNSDKEAIAASIFAHDDNGKIVSLGSIRSQGTLYPVSILDGKIMVAGHQFVRIYSIRDEEVPELVLDSYAEGDGPELDDWFRTFEKGTAVKFSKCIG